MPRILQLFNIFGALTEKALTDFTLGLREHGYDLTIGHETWADEAPVQSSDSELNRQQLQRIRVEPSENIDLQMQNIATNVTDPAMLNLLQQPFDLVHGHFGPRILQGAAWLRKDTPLLISLYGYDVGRLLKDASWIARYRWAAKNGTVFVALARFMEKQLHELGLPPKNIRRIHLGIDVDSHAFKPTPAPAPPRFVFIGRFVDKKGTDVLIDAMHHLIVHLKTPARLDLIGSGPNDAALRSQVSRLQLENHVRFVGVIPFSQLFDYLHCCTAMVQPSVIAADGDAEGAPMVLMTAQAVGVPCITTLHSGNPETIPPVGQQFVVPERDVAALAIAMKAMIDQPPGARTELQNAGRKWIETHFSLKQTIQQ